VRFSSGLYERNAMSNVDGLIGKLEKLRDDVNSRLDGLVKCKYGNTKLVFDDIDQRINDCIDAVDRLQVSIDKMKSFDET
jgi:hypothetical protein